MYKIKIFFFITAWLLYVWGSQHCKILGETVCVSSEWIICWYVRSPSPYFYKNHLLCPLLFPTSLSKHLNLIGTIPLYGVDYVVLQQLPPSPLQLPMQPCWKVFQLSKIMRNSKFSFFYFNKSRWFV